MKDTLLLTGATGFIGSHILENLVKNFRVIIIKRSSSNTHRIEHLLNKCLVYDIDNSHLEETFENETITGVIHLATLYKKTHTNHDIEEMIASNITFATKLLELSAKNNVRFFINTGTFFEYSPLYGPLNESSSLLPFNLYAATKSALNSMLSYYANNTELNILTLKLSAPFGYKDNFKLIPFLIDSLLKNKKISLEKGEQEWDFIYIKDVVAAYEKAIKFCLNSKRNFFEEVFISTNKVTSVKQIVEYLSSIENKNLIKCEKEYTSKQIYFSKIDNTKAKNLLGWFPQYSVETALKETYELYKEQM